MSTIRVYELAKEVNKTNKEVLDFLKSKNIELTSHMSNVDEAHANMVRDNYKKGNKITQEGNHPAKQEDGENLRKRLFRYSALRMPAIHLRKSKNRRSIEAKKIEVHRI